MERLNSALSLDRYDALLLLSCLAYFFLVAIRLNETNMGFNDQVMLYTSWRFADGAVLYKDILMHYPPLIAVIGALLLEISNSYIFVKIFDLLLSVATTIVVYKLSLKLFNSKKMALLSALIYLILPIRYALAPAFYPENYILFFMLVSILLLLNHTPRSMILSSIFSVLALFTKYTVLPLIFANVLYLLIRKRQLLKYYLLPLLVSTLSLTALLQVYSQGNFVSQTLGLPASFTGSNLGPFAEGLWAISKWEGLFSILFVIGFVTYLLQRGQKDYAIVIIPFSFLPVFFMLHEGTSPYVFNFAEPWIALFAAYGVIKIYSSASTRVAPKKSLLKVGTLILLVAISATTIYLYDRPGREVLVGWKHRDEVISDYTRAVRMYSGPNDTILAPSMLAFKSERRIALDIADVAMYLQSYQHGDAHTNGVIESLYGMLMKKEIRVIVPQGYYWLRRSYDYSSKTFMQYVFPFNLPEVATLVLNNYRPLNVNGVLIFVPNS